MLEVRDGLSARDHPAKVYDPALLNGAPETFQVTRPRVARNSKA